MAKQIIIAEQHRIAAVFADDQIQELIVAKGTHQIGDIYLGAVENVLPGIDAAFVNIGDKERNGFIHVSDLGPLRKRRTAGAITELLEPQQKVLVQVMKEPTGSKGPRLTGNVSLPGRYLVLMPFGRGVNLSRRILSEMERSRLRALAVFIKPAQMGLLVRTEAEGVGEEAIIEDLEGLLRQWESILQESDTTRPPALLNRDDDFIQRVLRDVYTADVNRIVVDSHTGLKRVKQHLMNWGSGKVPQGVLIDQHRERTSVLEYFRVNAAIREALKPRVDLPSGGYIVIEPTEALTVIDVNSGSFTRSATARETVLWTNFEAATEIARQLRLRNLAGVIVVDFIDMDSRKDQLQVLEHFTKSLRSDKARPQIAQLTELGLVELTRKRQGQNIYELFGQPCPTCNGLGHLVHLPGEAPPVEMTEEGEEDGVAARGQRLPSLRQQPELRGRRSLPVPESLPPAMEEFEPSWSEPELGDAAAEEEPADALPYDRGTRRRRRRDDRPVRNGLGDSEMETGAEEVGLPERESRFRDRDRGEGRPEGRLSRRGQIIDRPLEQITVEMTPDEQEVYAWLGISPLVLTEKTAINPRATLVTVALPGQAPVGEGAGSAVRDLSDFAEELEDSRSPILTRSPVVTTPGIDLESTMESSDEPEPPVVDEPDPTEAEPSGEMGDSEASYRRRRRRSSSSRSHV